MAEITPIKAEQVTITKMPPSAQIYWSIGLKQFSLSGFKKVRELDLLLRNIGQSGPVEFAIEGKVFIIDRTTVPAFK